MSLNWQWKDKLGELKYEEERGDEPRCFVISIYEGNAPMIFIHEYEEDGNKFYNLFTFFCDKDHFKNIVKNEGSSFFRGWKSISFIKYEKSLNWYYEQLFKMGVEISFIKEDKKDEN